MLRWHRPSLFLGWWKLIPILQWYEPLPSFIRKVLDIEDQIPEGLKVSHTLRRKTSEKINAIAWSPRNNIIAAAFDDNLIGLWDVERALLLQTLKGHSKAILCITWSPDGHRIASSSVDKTIRIWQTDTGQLLQVLKGHDDRIQSIGWSPDGGNLASGGDDEVIKIWNTGTWKCSKTFKPNLGRIRSLVWSPDSKILSSANKREIVLWDADANQLSRLEGHRAPVHSVAWSSDGQMIASASSDNTIIIWDPQTGQQKYLLEGHVNIINSVSFSSDNRLLASKSFDGTVRIWHTNSWETVALFKEEIDEQAYLNEGSGNLAFNPQKSVLATYDDKGRTIRIWDLNIDSILGIGRLSSSIIAPSVHYRNARVILIGDSGVGKSGLALVLTGQDFSPTTSTHGCNIGTFSTQEVFLNGTVREIREALLWDLAGQPGYRIVHQLYLNEVAIALIVFDSRNEVDPFAGVKYWDRALRTAKSLERTANFPTKKFLVAARVDRGGISVSQERLKRLTSALTFDGYFETSALQMQGIVSLIDEIKGAIDWEALPKVSSTDLFQSIKEFLIEQKKAGQVLSTADELYRSFLNSKNSPLETEKLRAQFETCIGLVEGRGLIQRLKFGNLILLQPEILDVYASALVNAVKDEPDGFGSIPEEKVLAGGFSIPADQRINNSLQENLLLIALIEDLIRHEIALREKASDGPYLVFPSQSTRESPDLQDPVGKTVIYRFQGPIFNIYATLVVRLAHTEIYKKKDLWKNAVTYIAKVGGTCGISLHLIEDGYGELTLFFDKETSEETRFIFEEYIKMHLKRTGVPESIQRQRIFECPECKTPFTNLQITTRRSRGFAYIRCSVCDTEVSLIERDELLAAHSNVLVEMDESANMKREADALASLAPTERISGSTISGLFDVFLCYNKEDALEVKEIGAKLRTHGVLPWLDEWELPPGKAWQFLLEQQIEKIKSVAIFVGKTGIGPWQQQEMYAFISAFIERGCPVIPILLKDTPKKPTLPALLRSFTWVDFRKQDPNPIEQLIWGITGRKFQSVKTN